MSAAKSTPTLPRRDEAQITTAHSVRKLAACAGCGGMGMKPDMLQLPGRDGYYHGHCVVGLLSRDEILALPHEVSGKLRLGATGPELMRALMDSYRASEGLTERQRGVLVACAESEWKDGRTYSSRWHHFVIASLVKRGLIERVSVRYGDDPRYVRITPIGRAAIAKATRITG